MNVNLRETFRLISSLLIVLIIGSIGTLFTLPKITTWYASLMKPGWAPPNWLFGPVWTTLYILIGISLYLVWREGINRRDVQLALFVFSVQLILNLIWSIVFFGFESILGGFILIILLWLSILFNIIFFYRVSKSAGLLLLPYLLWVTIASYLNYAVYILNP